MKYFRFAVMGLCALSMQAQMNVPDIVTKGLAAYEKSGGVVAMATWLKGSPIETDTTTKMTVTGGIAQIETLYGKMIGFETIRVANVTPSMLRVYVMLKFERGPVFFSFDCYRAEKDWTIPFIDFNSKAGSILPASILAGDR